MVTIIRSGGTMRRIIYAKVVLQNRTRRIKSMQHALKHPPVSRPMHIRDRQDLWRKMKEAGQQARSTRANRELKICCTAQYNDVC